MKLSLNSILLIALSLYSFADASPLAKRGCYHGGRATLTNYWISSQGDRDMTNNGSPLILRGPANTPLKTVSGKVIAKVDHATFNKCAMEGSCYINHKGGRMLINLDNNGGSDPRFTVLSMRQFPFGMGSNGNPLKPYTSVAVNDLKFQTTLYVKQLDGVKLPNGLTHNGCVSVDDNGWSFGGCQLDFFVLSFESYVKLNTPEEVEVTKKKCKVLDYTTGMEYDYIGMTPPKNVAGGGGAISFHHSKNHTSNGGSHSSSKGSHHSSSKGSTPKSSSSTDCSGNAVKTYSSTSFGGSPTCAPANGCQELSGTTKSAEWPSGKKLTLYSGPNCSGESLYVDSEGSDTDLSGDGNGFTAQSFSVQ